MRIQALYKWPLWVMEILGQGKSFKANPILGSRLLNRMGLHVARIVISHLVMQVRWLILSPLMDKNLRRNFHKDGFIAIEKFIDTQTVHACLNDIEQSHGQMRQMGQGNTLTERILLDRDTIKEAGALTQIVNSKKLKNLISYAGGRWRRPLLYYQRIKNSAREGGSDPQKNIHSDTFHPTVKAWLFLEDVTPEKGPFTYVRGSHRLTWARLKWEYKKSIKGPLIGDSYSEKGSLRVTNEELEHLGLPKPEGLSVKAGTLVIANTNGFHGRGQAQGNISRQEIWAYSRHNPFIPWPGIGFSGWTKLEEALLPIVWRHRDEQAEKNGKRPSWYKVEKDDILSNKVKTD